MRLLPICQQAAVGPLAPFAVITWELCKYERSKLERWGGRRAYRPSQRRSNCSQAPWTYLGGREGTTSGPTRIVLTPSHAWHGLRGSSATPKRHSRLALQRSDWFLSTQSRLGYVEGALSKRQGQVAPSRSASNSDRPFRRIHVARSQLGFVRTGSQHAASGLGIITPLTRTRAHRHWHAIAPGHWQQARHRGCAHGAP